MKVILALGVVLACSVTLSSAQCYMDSIKVNSKTRQKGCEHNGKFHKIGSQWTAECEQCSCNRYGMECCSLIHTPVYDKENCEAIFNKQSCSYTVIRKDNPSELCEITGMVG